MDYLAEVVWLDGQALAPTSFGEFDEDSGIWKPIDVSGLTFGTNGFYLDFEDSANLGNDANGGTDLTESNLAATDQSTDTCTNNYNVLTPLNKFGSHTLSEGNTRLAGDTGYNHQGTTFGVNKGKWYVEIKHAQTRSKVFMLSLYNVDNTIYTQGSDLWFNIANGLTTFYLQLQNTNHASTRDYTFRKMVGTTQTTVTSTGGNLSGLSVGIIGVYIDMDNKRIHFYNNGSALDGHNAASSTAGLGAIPAGTYALGLTDVRAPDGGDDGVLLSGGQQIQLKLFHQVILMIIYGQFHILEKTKRVLFIMYQKFSGVWIMAYTTIDKSSDYFNTKLYTGNGSTNAITTGTFQPDFCWFKNRGTAENSVLINAINGASFNLSSNLNRAETDVSAKVSAFTSTGVTLGSNAETNENSQPLVAWTWKANGSGSANTVGVIDSTVSVNATSGFTIVKWVATDENTTIGHGLGVAPKVIIVKSTTVTQPWIMGHGSLGFTKNLYLNQTDAENTSSTMWVNTAPTSTVFTTGTNDNVAQNGETFIAYCFQKFKDFQNLVVILETEMPMDHLFTQDLNQHSY